MERRLAGILAADVVGYARLMERDEAGTLAALKAHRAELLDPTIAAHKGRIFKSMGDAVLAEFASVVEAVQCALAIQRGMADRNAETPEGRGIVFRIGVHLGDVIVDGADYYGDGVNVAARLEGLAEPGGICLSQQVYDQIETKLQLAVEDLGPLQVKNIARPVRVYRARVGEPASAAPHAAGEVLTVADKPSIAVLPFVNMSDNPEQGYLSDGITEDIIAALSRFRTLFVMARTSSFAFKDRSVTAQDVGRALGVRYVVEGSVRRAGNRMRITVQLIDAATGGHLWAERYDRDVGDLFEVQDQVTDAIVATLAGRVGAEELERAKRQRPDSFRAYDYVLQAKAVVADTRENNERTRQLYEKAIALDAACAPAYSGLASAYLLDWTSGWSDSDDSVVGKAFANAKKALDLDPTDSATLRRIAWIQLFRGNHAEAGAHLERALSINPCDADALTYKGVLLIYSGRPQQAIGCVNEACRLNPYHPAFYLWFLGLARYMSGDYAHAIEPLRTAIDRSPNFAAPHRHLAATYAQLGQIDSARAEAAAVRRLDPDFTLAGFSRKTPYKNPADLERYLDGLRQAGLTT